MIQFLPPKLEALRPLRMFEPRHDELLAKFCAVLWDGTSPKELWQYANSGMLQLYETSSGLVMLETIDRPAGRELFIYGMVGTDILNQAPAIVRDLTALASYVGAAFIGAEAIPKGWSRIAKAFRFRPVSTHYLMELPDGR